ncbi:MAG: ATP-binding protein [Gammaproteobacteria bacterium]|nr:ATP-binding protein [Gammaproteobacteria bacterium]
MSKLRDEAWLQALIAQPEGERLERTAQFDFDGIRRKLGRTLCAFANDLSDTQTPGYFLIGVKDDKVGGGLSGYQYQDADVQKIVAWLNNPSQDDARQGTFIGPAMAFKVDSFLHPEGDVLLIEVPSSALCPHRFESQIWVRMGSITTRANALHEQYLIECKRRRTGLNADARACLEASLDDIDLSMFRAFRGLVDTEEVLEENQRSIKHQLAGLNLYDLHRDCPTVAGMVCFGHTGRDNQRKGLAHAASIVQFIRYAGLDKASPIKFHDAFALPMLVMRERLDALLKANMESTFTTEGMREVERQHYPFSALRELVNNAIAHRDYFLRGAIQINWFEKHVEILSPGGPVPPVTQENFGQYSEQRNPHISFVMFLLQMVERFGRGIALAQARLRQNGNPPAEFEFLGGTVLRVTVRSAV